MNPVYFLPVVFLACASAQTELSPQEAVELAIKSHPLLKAGFERTEAAHGYLMQSGLRPNPRFTFQTENWRGYGTPGFDPSRDSDIYAYVVKPLETAGKRERRLELAGASVRRSEFEREVLARQVALRVRQAYWNAAAAEKVHALFIETARNFQQIIDYHELRVKLGAMAEADLLKVRLEGERLQVSIQNAALDAERARIALFREMGLPEVRDVKLADVPADLELPVLPVRFELAQERPELKLARQIVEQARANAKLQRANAKPDLDVLLGYKRTAGFNTAIAGLQVTLPSSNRNQGFIAAADAEVRAAEAELAAVEASIKAEIRAAEADVRVRHDQLARVFGETDGGGLRGRAGESSRIAMAAYREGGSDLLRLLDSERVRIELQVLYYKTLADYRQSLVALDAALGVNP